MVSTAESRRVGNKLYQISPEVQSIAEEVIVKEKLLVEPAKVGYLLVYPYVSKKVAGTGAGLNEVLWAEVDTCIICDATKPHEEEIKEKEADEVYCAI